MRLLIPTTVMTLCLLASPVLAHELLTDQKIGAVIHVEPNDEPVAGEQAVVFFQFKDIDDEFTPQACDCEVSILQEERQIYITQLWQDVAEPTLDNAYVKYTFPQAGEYEVRIHGEPRTGSEFAHFELEYDVHVAPAPVIQPQEKPAPSWVRTHTFHLIAAIGLTLVTVGMIAYERIWPAKTLEGRPKV
jgi:hypothetical protein